MESTDKENEKTAPPKVDLLKVDIKDENTALNVLVGFLGLAQSRGVLQLMNLQKFFEAIKMFNGTPK